MDKGICATAAPGEVDRLVEHIQRRRPRIREGRLPRAGSIFSKTALLPKLIAELKSV
jgi:hypothetical protein